MVSPTSTTNISGESYSKGLRVDGHQYDGLIIENCSFTKKSLEIGNVNGVTIRNCTFKDISLDGIKIGFIGESSNITIENCSFENIGYNGIDSHEKAINCIIKGNYFKNVALSEIGPAMGQPHHGIYWKGKDVFITENTFINGEQPFGNSISIRSSGKVTKNKIFNPAKNGIMYYANHPGGDSLIMENNFIHEPTFYAIIMGSDGNTSNHNKYVSIRFNSTYQTQNESIYISELFENNTSISIYGNILVNTNGNYMKTFFTIPDVYKNLTSSTDIGYANVSAGDLHLSPNSSAINFCSGLSNFPQTDIDGNLRLSTNLDAGAHEVN